MASIFAEHGISSEELVYSEGRANLITTIGTTDLVLGFSGHLDVVSVGNEAESFHGKIKLLATVGEEIGMLGARQLTQAGYVDDVSAMVIGDQHKIPLSLHTKEYLVIVWNHVE